MSRQKIRFHPLEGPAREAALPFEGADHVVVEGKCPNLACDQREPFRAAGARGTMVRGHDTYTSDAGCVACKLVTGKLVVTVSTLFGVEEDERVLGGRCRVY